jgi:hypothetical protein
MNHSLRYPEHACALSLAAALSACAVPATQVEVPTQSMRSALEQARSARPAPGSSAQPPLPPSRVSAPPGAPQPRLAAPEVRMAYLYDWVDHEGNQHFASWVAIPLTGFDWVLGRGAPEAPSSPAAPPAADLESDSTAPEPGGATP